MPPTTFAALNRHAYSLACLAASASPIRPPACLAAPAPPVARPPASPLPHRPSPSDPAASTQRLPEAAPSRTIQATGSNTLYALNARLSCRERPCDLVCDHVAARSAGPRGIPRPASVRSAWVVLVLTVAKVSAGGGAAYASYLEGRAQPPEQGDYYLKDGERVEAPGRWALGPGGAAALGVDPGRPVEGDAFHAVMAVRHPVTGEQLRRVGANGEAVVAIDATFSAPKSLSAAWALGSPEVRTALEAAQERAVDRALEHAVEFVPMVRRRVDQETVVRELPREVLASSWQHTTARAVAGQVPDPQLHSHVLIHGALRSDGRVVAVESRAWLVHQREIGAAYRSELARELRELGFEVEHATGRGGRYFELVGVPVGLRERWSSRHHQVAGAIEQRLTEKKAALEAVIEQGGPEAADAAVRLDGLERSGRLMPAEERRFAISSRAAKGTLEMAGDLDRAWWETAVEYGFDARSVEQLCNRGREVQPAWRDLDSEILSRLTEFDATFAPREARAVALESAADLGPQAGLAALARLHERGLVLDLGDGRQTTVEHRALERATLRSADELATVRGTAVDDAIVAHEVELLAAGVAERGGSLAGEQERAVTLACSDRRLVVVVGQAGTGKSTALQGVARAHLQAGRTVLVISTGAQAAERLASELREAGVEGRGFSTAALRVNVERGAVVLDAGVTVIHDEAALASTREQAWLFKAVSESGARLVAIGDPRQSQAVGAGGLWDEIEQNAKAQDAFVELSRIVRAQDPADRRDQALWRAGQHEHALANYAERGFVVIETEQRRVEDLALDAAQADRRGGRDTLVLAETSNEQLDALNARAQAIRLQDGELGTASVSLSGRPYGLRAGDEVVVRAPVQHPEIGSIRNGLSGEVVGVDTTRELATLRLSDGREGSFDRDLLDGGQVRLAYVAHPFPAQGRTTDTTHVIAGPLSTAEGSYVALTRAREHTHVYASSDQLELPASRDHAIAALAERLGRSEPDLPSIRVPLAHERHVEREHEQLTLLLDSDRGVEDPSIQHLRAERDRLQALVGTCPRDTVERVQLLERDVERFRQAAATCASESERLRGELDALGPFARRGQRGRDLVSQIASSERRAEGTREAERTALAKLAEIQAGPDSPVRWEAEHPHVREQLRDAEQDFNAAVEREAARAIANPGEHLTRVLGKRPTHDQPVEREAWTEAARAVEAYRISYQIDPAEPSALGPEPDRSDSAWRQHIDWTRAGQHVLDAREQLDIERPGHGPTDERMARVPGLMTEQDREQVLDRGRGRER
jgi:conjugative relaxase-like TrwC/TraI family protein